MYVSMVMINLNLGQVTFSILSSEFVDTFENIELEDRTDTEEFLNTIVDITDVKKTNRTIRKLNKQFYWQSGVWLWNNQNYEYNEYSPKWFPKYKKIADNVKMPDYTKLNN